MPTVICSMIAYTCSRRNNGYQLYNSVALLACGISERVNNYLYSIGICSSRKSALEAIETLKNETELTIQNAVSKESTIQPFWCVDKIDFQARIHNPRVEASTRMFHGSWGYILSMPKHLLARIDPEDTPLQAFQIAMK